MKVTVNKELANYIKQKINTGDYTDSTEIVQEALFLLKEADEKKATFKAAIKAGYDDYKAGNLTDKSPKEIFDALMDKEQVSE